MKQLAGVLLSLAIAQAAFAAPPKTPAHRTTDASSAAQSYKAMSASERIAIETDLIWTGDYNGVADGDFGERAIAAVKAFQQRGAGRPTGVLNPQERTQLSASARTRQEAMGWRMVQDPVTGARLGIPTKLVRPSTQGPTGIRYVSGHGEIQIETFRVENEGHATLQQALDQQKDPARRIEYSVIKPDFFVISGLQGGVKKFYVRAAIKDGEVRGMTVLYDVATEGTMGRAIVAMSSAFTPFPPGSAGGHALRKLVEYSTGVVVDDVGHVLADRQAVDGCFAVTITGFGHAELAAQDHEAGLALLQLFGVPKLRPIPLAAATAAVGDVTVIGIADPQIQNGGAAVSTLRARVGAANGANRVLEPMPAVGFSGAAALHDDGTLAGMVEMAAAEGADKGELASLAVVASSEAIRSFLERQHVILAGAAPARSAEAGVVRVICTRK